MLSRLYTRGKSLPMKKQRKTKKIITFLLLFLFYVNLFSEILPVNAAQKGAEHKTVKVGYLLAAGYQEGKEGEPKSGFGYEYYQQISYYSGWKYEYVYGTFGELLEMLKAGEIDIMGNLSYTDERARDILYSMEEQGREVYYIYVTVDQTAIDPNDYTTLDGKKICVSKGSYQEGLLVEWCKHNEIDCEIVGYTDSVERTQALNNGEVDAALSVTITDRNENNASWLPIIKLGDAPFYFGVNKNRPDLLEDLNTALSKIQSQNRFYNNEVYQKYITGASQITETLSKEEKVWIASHDEIRVGYINDFAPYCFRDPDTHEINGMAPAVLSYIAEKYGVNFKYKEFNLYTEMIDALKNKEIDVMLPVLGDYWAAEEQGFCLTSSVTSSTMTMFYTNDKLTTQAMKEKIAISVESPFQEYYAKIYYPDAELVECTSIQECMAAVREGRANSTIANTNIYQIWAYQKNFKQDIKSIPLHESIDVCFAVCEDDITFLTFMSRGVSITPDSIINDALVSASNVEREYSFVDVMKNNVLAIVIIGIAVLLVIVLTFWHYAMVTTRNKRELLEANKAAERAKEEAVRANTAKSEFLSRISHDIRTPVNGIMGMLDISQKSMNNPEKLKECHDKIRTSSGYLLSLINDVLDMSKLEAGEVELVEEPFDIRELYKSCADIFQPLAEKNAITVNELMDENIAHPYIIGSPLHLRQILVNVITNAIKYNKVGGSVTSTIKEASCTEDVVTYQFIITDSGIGISEDFQMHMFESFTQENGGGRTTYQGSGLGLAIVKKMVEQMKGEIAVSSKINEGSTFIITIPLQIDKSPSMLETSAVGDYASVVSGMRVLLVEDNALNMEIAKYMLEEAQIVVTEAIDGQQAVDAFIQSEVGQFDMILMDIMMPVMDGLTATRVIRALDRADAKTIPIIALTANAYAEDAKKAKEAGMNEHIAKPINAPQMLKAMAEFHTIINLTKE